MNLRARWAMTSEDWASEGPSTWAVLVTADGQSMRMPLNKIARYINEGPENSTHDFVAAEVSAGG